MIGLLFLVVAALSPELDKAVYVRIHPAAADFVPSGFWEIRLAEAGKQRSGNQHRAPELSTAFDKFARTGVFGLDSCRAEAVLPLAQAHHLNAQTLNQGNQLADIPDFGDIADCNRIFCQKSGADDLQGLVLGALRNYAAAQSVTTFYDE